MFDEKNGEDRKGFSDMVLFLTNFLKSKVLSLDTTPLRRPSGFQYHLFKNFYSKLCSCLLLSECNNFGIQQTESLLNFLQMKLCELNQDV